MDCHLYRQPQRLVLHIVNLSSPGAWRQPIDELIAIGPLRVKVKPPDDVPGGNLRLLVPVKPFPAKQKKAGSNSGSARSRTMK